MNEKGFTLTELLVVIVIIGIISVIVVPSVITINKNINTRLYNQKIEYIVDAAELYGSNHPELFNGTDERKVYVYELIEENYLEIDSKQGEGSCTATYTSNPQKGCINNPLATDTDRVLNDEYVVLTKKSTGVKGVYMGKVNASLSTSDTLVRRVCDGFKNNEFIGKYGTNDSDTCKCVEDANHKINIVSSEGSNVNACIITSKTESGDVNNWLKYGSSTANWRVLGLYRVTVDGSPTVVAKMITSGVVE